MSTSGRARVAAIDYAMVFIATPERIASFASAALPDDWKEVIRDEQANERLATCIDRGGVPLDHRLAEAPMLPWTLPPRRRAVQPAGAAD